MEQDLRIRMATEAVAQALQLPAQLRGIIQFSVIYDAVLPVSGRKDHGLGPALQIDDGEPAVEQSAPFGPVAAVAVRPPAFHGPEHPFYGSIFQRCPYSSGDPTHAHHSLLGDMICCASQKGAWSHRREGILISGDTI